MAIKITVNSSEGVNVNSGNGNYLDTFPATFDTSAGNFGYFRGSFSNSKEYGIAEDKQSGTQIFNDGAALVAGGKLTYALVGHTLTGKLNTLAFGEDLTGVTGASGVTNANIGLGETALSFSQLGLDSAKGGKVHDILYGMMTGDADAFLNYLATHAVSFVGGSGNDTYVGSSKADTLSGGAGEDMLSGGRGNDTLIGGAGADNLDGNAGRDVFVFRSATHSTLEEADTISGFAVGSKGDRIDLGRIDANSNTSKNNAFDYIGTDAFSQKAGELRAETVDGVTSIYGDVDGDGVADLVIHLDLSSSLRESNFLL